MSFQKIRPDELSDNIFTLIGKDWMLVTAGEKDCCNTMTASWGMAGFLWNKPVTEVFVRPQRHTFGFTQKYGTYTCCFFDENYRDALKLCGSVSGRDHDKFAETGLTPVYGENGIYYEEARLVICCKKLYAQKLERNCFYDGETEKNCYPARDYHMAYIGEITECLLKKD